MKIKAVTKTSSKRIHTYKLLMAMRYFCKELSQEYRVLNLVEEVEVEVVEGLVEVQVAAVAQVDLHLLIPTLHLLLAVAIRLPTVIQGIVEPLTPTLLPIQTETITRTVSMGQFTTTIIGAHMLPGQPTPTHTLTLTPTIWASTTITTCLSFIM